MKMKKKGKLQFKQILQIAILGTIILSLYFSLKLVKRRQDLVSHAALTQEAVIEANLSFSPPSPANPQTVGNTFATSGLRRTKLEPFRSIRSLFLYHLLCNGE